MQRSVGLFALTVCACLVAGCGSALQAKARKVVGDPHATVVSTQTVDPLGGGPLTVVVMKPGGTQGLGCIEALVSGGSNSGCPGWSDAYVLLNPKTHAAGIDQGISTWQVAAIAKARATNPRLGIFPIVNQLTVRCATTHLNLGWPPGMMVHGMCNTMALPFGGPVRCVAFIMGWRPGAGAKMKTAAVVARFDRTGHIRSTHLVASPPPPWNGHRAGTCSQIR